MYGEGDIEKFPIKQKNFEKGKYNMTLKYRYHFQEIVIVFQVLLLGYNNYFSE